MPNLFKETAALVEMRRAMEGEGVPEEAVKDTLLANSDEFEGKAIALYQATTEIDYDVQVLDAMIADLTARKKMLKTRQESARRMLLDAMLTTGIASISCPFFTISTKKGSQSLIIDNEEDIPDKYVEVEVLNKVDKKAITKDIREGKEVPGAHLSEAETILQVRTKK